MSGIVSNTTPLNYLILIERVDVLRHLYGRVLIPLAVFEELQALGTPSAVKSWMASPPNWLEIQTVPISLDVSFDDLDAGEREAIRLVKEIEADALIIDETDGRKAAITQSIRVIGTLRVLYDAVEAGLCDLEQAYHRLQQTTFRAHPNLYKTFLDAFKQQL